MHSLILGVTLKHTFLSTSVSSDITNASSLLIDIVILINRYKGIDLKLS